jgi:hypothetical protein
MKEVRRVQGEEPAGLVGPERIVGGSGGVNPLASVVLLGTGRRGQPHLEGSVQLPEVSLGVAPSPVALQELEAVHLLGRRIGQEEEVVEEELPLIAGPLEDHEDDPTGRFQVPAW